MNEKEFGDRLLGLDIAARPAADVQALTDRVLARDRRRVRLLTWLTVGSWSISAGLVLTLLVIFALLFPLWGKIREDESQGRLTPIQREQVQTKLEIGFRMTSVGITVTVGALSLAGLCTMGLLLATRKATLRQVNANLAEIAEQLKQLRQPPPSPATGS